MAGKHSPDSYGRHAAKPVPEPKPASFAGGVDAIAPTSTAPVRDPSPGQRPAGKKPAGKAVGRAAVKAAPAPVKTAAKVAAKRRKGKVSVTSHLPDASGFAGSNARRIIVAEFALCALIVALSPLTDKHKSDPPQAFIKRISAVALLFMGLGLVSTGGHGAAKVAGGFGGLVTLALLISNRDIFSVIASRLNEPPETGPAGPPGDPSAGGPGGGERAGSGGTSKAGTTR